MAMYSSLSWHFELKYKDMIELSTKEKNGGFYNQYATLVMSEDVKNKRMLLYTE